MAVELLACYRVFSLLNLKLRGRNERIFYGQVVVYACLSSSWVPVREFGPGTIAATITPTDRKCGYQRVDFTGDQNQTENFEFPSILVEKSKEGGSGELKANHQDMGVGTPKTGDEKVEARGAGDRMQEGIEWGTGVPVSARFLRLKVRGEGRQSSFVHSDVMAASLLELYSCGG